MNRTHFLSLAIFWAIPSVCLAQSDMAETFLEEQAESSEQSELLELILSLKEQPIDLNRASAVDLEMIPFLTPALRHQIVQYRSQNGPFSAKEELLNLTGMDEETFSDIRDLVTVTRRSQPSAAFARFEFRSRVQDRIDQPRGYQDGTYESGSQKLYNRLKFQLRNNIEGGLLLEKDSGERRIDDLRLFYVSSRLSKNLNVILGHYQIEAGQGLVVWGPYGFSKSAQTIYPVKKKARGIREYMTVDENAAFFGGAAAFEHDWLQMTVFVSRNRLDATPISEDQVSGLFLTGFHRNPNEHEKQDILNETLYGARIAITPMDGFALGITHYRSFYNMHLNDPDSVRSRFEFRGNKNAVTGLDWSWTNRELELFGEIARSKNGAFAYFLGSILDFNDVQLAFAHRNYHKDFQNLHGFGFAETNGTTQNERGYYAGVRYRLSRKTTFHAYYDLYSKPWRSYFDPLPTEGHEFLLQIEHKFDRRMRVKVRWKQERRQQTEAVLDEFEREFQRLATRDISQVRLQFDASPSNQIRLRTRMEYVNPRMISYSRQDSRNETGFLVYQDIRLRPVKQWSIEGRITFFDTDSFDSRVFQYENDLPGVLTNRALFGRGNRRYLLLKYRPFRQIQIHAKYSETYRDDTESIGSGPDQIEGNIDRRVGLQLEMKI